MKFRHATDLEDYISILESDDVPIIYKYILYYYQCFIGDVINSKYVDIYAEYLEYIKESYKNEFYKKIKIYSNGLIQNSIITKKLVCAIINLDYESVNDHVLDISNCLKIYEEYTEQFFTDDFFYYTNDVKIKILKDILTNCTYKYNSEIHIGDLSGYIKPSIYMIKKTHYTYHILFTENAIDNFIIMNWEDISITDPLIRATMPKYYISICNPKEMNFYTVNVDLYKYDRDYKINKLLHEI